MTYYLSEREKKWGSVHDHKHTSVLSRIPAHVQSHFQHTPRELVNINCHCQHTACQNKQAYKTDRHIHTPSETDTHAQLHQLPHSQAITSGVYNLTDQWSKLKWNSWVCYYYQHQIHTIIWVFYTNYHFLVNTQTCLIFISSLTLEEMGGEGAELGVEIGGGYINDTTIDMKCDGIKYAEIRDRSLCNTPGIYDLLHPPKSLLSDYWLQNLVIWTNKHTK